MTLGEVGKETVGALRSTPLMLVVVLLNVMMLALIGYSVMNAQANTRHIIELALEKCGK